MGLLICMLFAIPILLMILHFMKYYSFNFSLPIYDTNFENFYSSIIVTNEYEELKKQRKNMHIFEIITILLIIFGLPLSLATNKEHIDSPLFTLLTISILFVAITISKVQLYFLSSNDTPRENYRKMVAKKLVSYLINDSKYIEEFKPENVVSDLYLNSLFHDLQKKIDYFSVNHYIEYKGNNNLTIKLANLSIKTAQKTFYTDPKFTGFPEFSVRETTKPYFNGFIAKIPSRNFYIEPALLKANKIIRLFETSKENRFLPNNFDTELYKIYEKNYLPFEISINKDNIYIKFLIENFNLNKKPSPDENYPNLLIKSVIEHDYITLNKIITIIDQINLLFNENE
ncbi:MAG: hypothetical protein IJS47_02475 [Clostridia bacterium]|nr:hypothetical protein [Clostridia bacterium]